jgi:hypothetical protein
MGYGPNHIILIQMVAPDLTKKYRRLQVWFYSLLVTKYLQGTVAKWHGSNGVCVDIMLPITCQMGLRLLVAYESTIINQSKFFMGYVSSALRGTPVNE